MSQMGQERTISPIGAPLIGSKSLLIAIGSTAQPWLEVMMRRRDFIAALAGLGATGASPVL